ncbi:NAD(P)-binding protein [Lophiostoma macrostomum CBS 122681]|uniref:Short-chain dehydrogenase/reductase 3 n=1 Tax=Lophiostoma macrostomum CBS 122681 TaxID=1314788 RepID=A0A6A6SS35_9PLEO|nr:NAD(P)-binding protein [Lophiostoma macrostomum CBS 122681]
MLRLLAFAAAYLGLAFPPSFIPRALEALPISEEHGTSAISSLRWFFAICLLWQVNVILSRWAENRWSWRTDRSAWNWEKEVAVVTGGSSGIGAEIVQRLISHGIRVAVLDIVPLSDALQHNDHISFYQCDVGSRHAVQKAGEAVRSDLGVPSILLNNAGIGNGVPILEVPPERLRAIFDVNILSHWNTVQEFLPGMIAMKKGHVMSTASLAAFSGLAGTVDYCATKAGVMAFHEGLAQELKHRYNCPEIKTTIVYPSWTRTPMASPFEQNIKRAGSRLVDAEYVAGKMVDRILARRSGQLILGPTLFASARAFPMWLQEYIRDTQASIVKFDAPAAAA